MLIGIISCLVIVVVICVIGFYLLRKKSSMSEERYNVLALTDVIKFFKQPNIIAMLKKNSNYVAVVIKEKSTDGQNKFVLCVYDKEQNAIVDTCAAMVVIIAEQVGEDLLSLFGSKDMIVLK